MTKLLTELELGDKKPSQLLREMRSLAGSMQVKDDFLKTIFMQRLSVTARSILATSKDDLDTIATMADKIVEISQPGSNICAQTLQAPSIITASKINDTSSERISRLETQIAELTLTVNELKTLSRSRSSSRSSRSSQSRSRDRSRSAQRFNPNGALCWYHFKYRHRAKKCQSPCSYQPPPAQNSSKQSN